MHAWKLVALHHIPECMAPIIAAVYITIITLGRVHSCLYSCTNNKACRICTLLPMDRVYHPYVNSLLFVEHPVVCIYFGVHSCEYK